MARKTSYSTAYDYKLVDDKASLEEAIPELKRNIEHNSRLIAVDCEGDNLTRKGALTIITVASEEKAYIFDVLKLGQAVFSSGLDEILEDKSCTKLTFDCREDSDALWHQFNVKLTGVLDLQLLEILYRRENEPTTGRFSYTGYRRRSQETDEVESIYGFRRCLELYVQDGDLITMKDKGSKLLKIDEKVWTRRPLTRQLIQYCIVDTMAMFRLYNKMKHVNGGRQDRIRVASERYADMFRSKTIRSFDEYEKNAFLPLHIIPHEGALGFSFADTECTCCRRHFPPEEFKATVVRRGRGDQKCRVCKEIKRRADARRDREARWARNWMRYGYDDDDDWW